MSQLKIGMIGAGFIGQLAHLMNFIEIPDCRMTALAEMRPELRKRVAFRYEISQTYATHDELLQHSDVDAVIVVTPRHMTGPVVLDCLQAGKHVLSEKPMAASLEQGRRLVAAAETKQLHYAVGYMKRYDEGVELAKKILTEALANKSLGTLLSVHAKCFSGNSYCNAYGHVVTQEKTDYVTSGWPIAPDWLPAIHHQAYAVYLNTYSHVTNLLRYLFNEMPAVDYVNLTEHAGQLAVLRFSNFITTLETGRMSHRGWSEEVRITFSDGEIVIGMPPALLRNVPATVEVYSAGKIQERTSHLVNWTWAFRRQAENFVSDIRNQQLSRISAKYALEDIELTEQIWQHEMTRVASAQVIKEAI